MQDTRADMEALTKRVLSYAKADETRVTVRSPRSLHPSPSPPGVLAATK